MNRLVGYIFVLVLNGICCDFSKEFCFYKLRTAGLKDFSVKCTNQDFENAKLKFEEKLRQDGLTRQADQIKEAFIQLKFNEKAVEVSASKISDSQYPQVNFKVNRLMQKYEDIFGGMAKQWHQIIYDDFSGDVEEVRNQIKSQTCEDYIDNEKRRHLVCLKGKSFKLHLNKTSKDDFMVLEGTVEGKVLLIMKSRVKIGENETEYTYNYTMQNGLKVLDKVQLKSNLSDQPIELKAQYYDWKVN